MSDKSTKSELEQFHSSDRLKAEDVIFNVQIRLECNWRPGRTISINYSQFSSFGNFQMSDGIAKEIINIFEGRGWTVEKKGSWIFKRLIFS